MAFSGVTVSTATSSIIDPNKGKPGYKLNPNTERYELPPANPQGMDWTFNEKAWAWEPPAASSFQSYKQRITGGETTGIGDTINADATLTATQKSELLALIMTTRRAANADSSRAKWVTDSDSEGEASGTSDTTSGAKEGTSWKSGVLDIGGEKDKDDNPATGLDPAADQTPNVVETDQDIADKYIKAIKADPLGKVIIVDGKAQTDTTPAVQRLISNYTSSLEHDRLVTAAQSALTPAVNVSQATREAVVDTGPTKDPNENREGYYQSKSSLNWVPLPPNPGGLDWTFDYQTEAWGPPPAPSVKQPDLETEEERLARTATPEVEVDESWKTKDEGFGWKSDKEKAATTAEIYRERISNLTSDSLRANLDGDTEFGLLAAEVQADQSISAAEKLALITEIQAKRADVSTTALTEDDTTSLEDELFIGSTDTDSDTEDTGNGVFNPEDLLPERSTDDITIGGETPEGDPIPYDPRQDPNAPEYLLPGGGGYDPKTDPNAPEYYQPGGQGYLALEKQNLIEFERYKEILIKEPDKDIEINEIYSSNPDLARMITEWMATAEYSNAQRIYSLKNPVEGNGIIIDPDKLKGDDSKESGFTTTIEELLEEETIEDLRADPFIGLEGYAKHPYTKKWTELPPNDKGEGATWNQAIWKWEAAPGVAGPAVDESTTSEIEDPNVGKDGYYERPSSGKWELAPPMPEEMIPGPGASNTWDMPTFDPESWTWKAAESREAFLSRMPAVPGHLDTVDAIAWLADQEGVTEDDAKRWIFWARDTGRTPTEEPIETLLARLPTVPSSKSNAPGMIWLMEKLIEQGVPAEDAEKDAQRWFDWANETNRKVDATVGTDFDSLVASAGVELDAEQLATLRKAFNEGGPVRFESVLNQIKGTDFLEEEEEEELLTEAGSDIDVTLEEEEPLEEFLARLPAIPSDMSNFAAFQLLADSVNAGTISGDDALRWLQWAKENRDDPAEAWKEETTPTEPTEAETIQNKIRTSQDFLTHQAGGLGDPGSPHRELTAQEISLLEGAYRSGGEAAYNALLKDIIKSKQDNYASIMGEGKDVIPERSLEDYASISPYLDGERAKYLIEQPLLGLNDDQVIRAGEVLNADGEDALAGYIKAFQNGTLEEWEANYAEVLADREGDRAEAGDEVIVDSLYTYGTPEYEAAVANISIEDILLKIPEPPAGLDILDRVFWLTDQVDAEGNPLLSPHEAMVYADWAREQQANTDANTSVEGEGGMGNAGDPANLESIQSTIATEIENTVQDMGFNSEEYKASQTTAIEDRYEDARLRLGRQFAIDPGGPKTGRAQRQFELLENQRIQDLAALDSEVQDRLQAARDSTITNLVNAFSTITTGKMAEEQLDEQQRQFNTELRETVRQFNNDIAIRLKEFGLSETEIEAAIKKINSDIVNNTRAISADISQAWADVTGDVGVPGGLLSLEDLGIPESEWAMFPYMPPSEDMKNSIRMSFSAMLGRDITDGELNSLIANGRINVEDNMPTQKAKEFAATIMQQNMDRISKYDAIAAENGLDRDKFNDAKERADKEWNRINLEVAEQYGLDSNRFRNAMWNLDQRLTDVFFNPDLTEEQRIQQREDAINNVIISYGYQDRQEQGAFLQAKDQYDLLYGDRERAIATAFGIDGDAFARASRQADAQESRMLNVWASLVSDKSGELLTDMPRLGERYDTFFSDITDLLNSGYKIEFKRDAAGKILPITDDEGEMITTPVTVGEGPWFPPVHGMDFSQATVYAQTFISNPKNSAVVESIRERFELEYGLLFPDEELSLALATNIADVTPTRRPTEPMNIKGVKKDWFSLLTATEQEAIMSLISGSNFSPEREAGGVSALSSIGRAFGIGIGAVGGAYIAAKTNNLEAIPAAINVGARVGAELGE